VSPTIAPPFGIKDRSCRAYAFDPVSAFALTPADLAISPELVLADDSVFGKDASPAPAANHRIKSIPSTLVASCCASKAGTC
jgi:hypothetical protein